MMGHSSQTIEKRKGFYIMLEAMIEASPRPDGTCMQEIYLEGRLADQARNTGGIDDDRMLELLKSCEGFRQLVHSIGVSIHSEEEDISSVRFALENWGKTNKYTSGSRIEAVCPADGSETILKLSDFNLTAEDDVPGKFTFEFQRAGALATVNIIFYLNDGYDAPELKPDAPVAIESEAYRDMIRRSLLHAGNNYRLKKAIEKAKRGQDVTIAYIGGSITQGAGAKPIHSTCYAYQSYSLFKQLFGQNGGEHIHFVKAGVGGTPSELGMIRYERDVLKNGSVQPDIVIIEFAVNDADDETEGRCYESLALKALAADNKPAVILLFSVFMNDWNLQDRLSPVGLHYDLPMVSVKDAVVEQFYLSQEEGNLVTKRQYFYDTYHPTNIGHRIMGDCLALLFAETDQAASHTEDIDLRKPPVIGNDFIDIQLLDRVTNINAAHINEGGFSETDTELQMVEMDDQSHGTPQFPHNWMHTAESGNESFRMMITCKKLVIVYKDSGNTDFGTIDIWDNGQLIKQADARAIQWTHCHASILFNEQVAREHHIEIRMTDGHEQKKFTILGFGYVK